MLFEGGRPWGRKKEDYLCSRTLTPTTTAIYKLHSNTLVCMSPLLLVFLHQTTAGTWPFHEALYMEGTTGSDLYDLHLVASSELQNVTDTTDISVRKKLARWGKSWRTKKFAKTNHFWEDLCKKIKVQWTNSHELIVYPHLFITRNLISSVL